MAEQWHKIVDGEVVRLSGPAFVCFLSIRAGIRSVRIVERLKSDDWSGDYVPVAWKLITIPAAPRWAKEKSNEA